MPFEYWDTCIFLAYIQKETHRPGEAEEISSQVRRFELGGLKLFTSTITITEICEAARLDTEQLKVLRDFFKRSNFQFVDATEQVCTLASEIRSHFKSNPIRVNGNELYPTTPDAIQVASAIAVKKVLKIDSDLKLVTLDSKNKSKTGDLALTALANYIQKKYGVLIRRPEVPEILRYAAGG